LDILSPLKSTTTKNNTEILVTCNKMVVGDLDLSIDLPEDKNEVQGHAFSNII